MSPAVFRTLSARGDAPGGFSRSAGGVPGLGRPAVQDGSADGVEPE